MLPFIANYQNPLYICTENKQKCNDVLRIFDANILQNIDTIQILCRKFTTKVQNLTILT